LKKLAILAFEGARERLGKNFNKAADQASSYSESYREASFPEMLAVKHTDVVVSDISIFLDSIQIENRERNTNLSAKDFEIHPLFEPRLRGVGFRDPKLCEEFNDAVAKLKASGEYDAIYKAFFEKTGYPLELENSK
jgi:hypothetical protein